MINNNLSCTAGSQYASRGIDCLKNMITISAVTLAF